VSPAYWIAVSIGAAVCLALTLVARLRPGDWTLTAGRVLAVVLATDFVTSVVRPIAEGTFTVRASVPLSLCDVGLVGAAIYLVVGLRCRPRRRAVPRIFVITLAYAAGVGVFDAATGANYLFLRAKPATGSLLSVLGPWPWYIGGAAALALVVLVVLDAPFWPGRRGPDQSRNREAPQRSRT
jgi:uncharacterized membrane protein YwaF